MNTLATDAHRAFFPDLELFDDVATFDGSAAPLGANVVAGEIRAIGHRPFAVRAASLKRSTSGRRVLVIAAFALLACTGSVGLAIGWIEAMEAIVHTLDRAIG